MLICEGGERQIFSADARSRVSQPMEIRMFTTEVAVRSLAAAVRPLAFESWTEGELLVFRVRAESGRLAVLRSTAQLARVRDARRGHEFIALTLREELEDRGHRLKPWIPPAACRSPAN